MWFRNWPLSMLNSIDFQVSHTSLWKGPVVKKHWFRPLKVAVNYCSNKLNFLISVLCCNFDGLLASCRMTLGGIPLEVSARINHCHTPIDVTFLVQSETTLLKNFTPNDNEPVEVNPKSSLENVHKWRHTIFDNYSDPFPYCHDCLLLGRMYVSSENPRPPKTLMSLMDKF